MIYCGLKGNKVPEDSFPKDDTYSVCVKMLTLRCQYLHLKYLSQNGSQLRIMLVHLQTPFPEKLGYFLKCNKN